MANWQDPQTTGVNTATVGVPRAARDVGLRSYMLSVYNYMASGVLLTGIVALLFAPYARQVLVGPRGGLSGLGWIVTLAPLGFVFAMSFGVNRMQTSTLRALFWALRGGDGPVDVDLVPGLYRRVDRPDLLRDRGGLPRAEPVRLHHQARL